MWQPLQIVAGVAVILAGIVVFRGLRRSLPRPGILFWLLRMLRRLAAVIIVFIGLGVTLEGTPYMTANICLDILEPDDWCFGGDDVADEAVPAGEAVGADSGAADPAGD
jgi:hypothetical protein